MDVSLPLSIRKIVIPLWVLLSLLVACQSNEKDDKSNELVAPPSNLRFTLMDQEATGVRFINQIRADYQYNHFSFDYMYSGGGVAAGDVNGDGLPDLYFSSSRGANRLYLNVDRMRFVDITKSSGVQALEGFKTGVTMADVNGDGRLDIYSCRTSKSDDGLKSNLLFINLGNRLDNGMQVPYFEEQSAKLGLSDNSNTNHGSFLDFDRDGDLDLFLVNHKLNFDESNKIRLKVAPNGKRVRATDPETPYESNRLFRNDKGRFVDVTKSAGVTSSAYGFSCTVADINQDGWMDIYVANDYVEPDFVYINNHDGTFTDHYTDYLRHSSLTSMGSDIADINNDGLVDIMVLDMKSEDPVRYKMLDRNTFDRYNLLVQFGYGRQAGRNMLQLNNGNLTFSEIGQFAGVATTDWSWGVLLADFDNDGWKDIYVSNGYRKDVTQLDYLNYSMDSLAKRVELSPGKTPDINAFLKNLPETKLAAYLFSNNRNLQFTNATKTAGINQLSFKNGCAYADLDRDGDLDIIVNNIDEPAFIYRNDSPVQHWLSIGLLQPDGNTNAIGAAADLYTGGNHQHLMMITNHGFFSSSEPLLHFGLGGHAVVDSIILRWPDGSIEKMEEVPADQRMVWKKGSGKPYREITISNPNKLFSNHNGLLSWNHFENPYVDLKKERLIPYSLSTEGPCIAVGDLNGDGLEDIFAGNGRGAASGMFFQTAEGILKPATVSAIQSDAAYEDCGAVVGDFDSDQDNDLVVISGGNDLPDGDQGYLIRYYRNDGKGNFSRENRFPVLPVNAGAVVSFDYDRDQDLDLLIAGRCSPGGFPSGAHSVVLQNNQGEFTEVTKTVFAEFDGMGMITDLEHGDLDGDGKDELVLAGEWMPIKVFTFDGKKFIDKSESFGLAKTNGWWKSILLQDLDKDGDIDLVAGNMGTNNRFTPSVQYPLTMITNDFDKNGSLDPIMCFYYQDKLFPYAGRDAIIGQIPMLKKKYTRYNPYAAATIPDIFSKEELDASTYLYTYSLKTVLFRNENKKMVAIELPYQVQLSPVFDIVADDFNGDGKTDLLLGGNFLYAETETGEMDAGNGSLLLQQPDGQFVFVQNREHGFWAQQEVRDLKMLKLADGRKAILTGNNNGPIETNIVLNSSPREQ